MLSRNIASKQANKDEGHESAGGSGRKTSSLRPPDQILNCPRCDSPNTKFCYYNNYSLAQPRHFCKACRRYWTKGGALRNVPIGGSCRKNKKTKSSCSSRCFLGDSTAKGSADSDIGGMKFYGLSAIDFQLGGLNLPPPRVTGTTNQLISSSYGDTSSTHSNSFDPLGFNVPFSSSHNVMKQGDHHHHHHQNYQSGGLASFHEMGTSNNIHLHQNTHDLASSIESLSSINQDLHWKLQQQRLAMLYGGGGVNINQQQKEVVVEPQAQKLQPILFQNLETSKPASHESSMDGDSRKDGTAGGSGLATEWFFDNSISYAAPLNLNPSTPTNSNSAGNNDQNGISMNNNWNGIHQAAWNHFS